MLVLKELCPVYSKYWSSQMAQRGYTSDIYGWQYLETGKEMSYYHSSVMNIF